LPSDGSFCAHEADEKHVGAPNCAKQALLSDRITDHRRRWMVRTYGGCCRKGRAGIFKCEYKSLVCLWQGIHFESRSGDNSQRTQGADLQLVETEPGHILYYLAAALDEGAVTLDELHAHHKVLGSTERKP
jgi:hypothetical protein